MAPDFGKVFGSAFRFAFSAQRLLPIFILSVAAIGIVFGFFMMFASVIMNPGYLAANSFASFLTSSFILNLVGIIILLVILGLIYLFFFIALVDNAGKYWKGNNASILESLGVAKQKYISVLVAVILTGLITAALAMIPIIGMVLAVVISWFFLFVIPAIVIWGDDAVNSIVTSSKVFMENKLNVFLFWLVLLVLSFVLFLIAIIPVAVAIVSVLPSTFNPAVYGTNNLLLFNLFITSIEANIAVVFIGALVSAVIFSYLLVFSEAAKTFMLMSFKKPKK